MIKGWNTTNTFSIDHQAPFNHTDTGDPPLVRSPLVQILVL